MALIPLTSLLMRQGKDDEMVDILDELIQARLERYSPSLKMGRPYAIRWVAEAYLRQGYSSQGPRF